jgi:multiple sugar transport system substrate-binding protein
VGPDIFESFYDAYIQAGAETGIVLELDPYLERYGLGFTDSDAWPGLREQASFDGKQYGVPLSVQARVLFYNRNIFDRFGVPYPRGAMTWREFIEIAKRVTYKADNPYDSVYGIVKLNHVDIFNTLRGEYFSEDGTEILIDGEEMVRAVQLYRDLADRHGVRLNDDQFTELAGRSGGDASQELFAQGRFAMITRPKSMLSYLRQAIDHQKVQLAKWETDPDRKEADRPEVIRVGATLLPHFEGLTPSYGVIARSVAVNRRSPKREAVLRFLSFLKTEEYCRIVNETLDYLPPNPRYVDVGLSPGYAELSELEVHYVNVEALKFGYSPRKSIFLSLIDLNRILARHLERMNTNRNLDTRTALREARKEADALMHLNLKRNPHLRRRYEAIVNGRNQGTPVVSVGLASSIQSR